MLLLLTAVVGVILAVHGWSGRQSGLASATLGASTASAPAGGNRSPGPTGAPSPRHAPSASGSGAGSAGPNAVHAGPLLRSQGYASYAFLVWPGPRTAAAKTAMTGLSVSVHRTASGLSLTAGVIGQPRAPARSYPGGARVYIIEASLGDEAGNSDYNLGDDGLVVTDAHGRILQ